VSGKLLVRLSTHRLRDTGGVTFTVEHGTCRGDWCVEHYGIPQSARARYQELNAIAKEHQPAVENGR
jgi:hypothetical protein